MPTESPVIDPLATYNVTVARTFYVNGVVFTPEAIAVTLSGALVSEFQECLSSYVKVEE
jgi:hypothetical protein